MSRYHDAIVSGIVFTFVVGLVALAELTKNKTTPNETMAPVISAQNSGKGFSFAQVLVEQEIASLNKGQINGPQHEEQVRSQVARLSKADLKSLKIKSRSLSNSWEERYASAYLLNIAGVKTDMPQRPAVQTRSIASVSKTRVVAKKTAVKEFARGKVPTKQTKIAKRNPDLMKKSLVKTSKRLTGQVASREIAVAKR
jgi:phage FluMu protein gp41